MEEKTIKLKVAEAMQDDLNLGIVRISSQYLKELNVMNGYVLIKGEKETVARVERAYPGDIGLNIIRMDSLTRKNAKATMGQFVTVKKFIPKHAKKVIIAPAKENILIKADNSFFKNRLIGRVVIKNELVGFSGFGRFNNFNLDPIESHLSRFLPTFGNLHFIIVDSFPKNEHVLITENTEVVFNPEPVIPTEEKIIDISYEDIGGLEDEVAKVREMIELPLKYPQVFERLGIEPPKGVLLHGPPGTGKTLLAKAVANETDSHFILINGPEIMSKFYGESEANLRKKFEEAEKNAPSIIFIDEIDAIASKREESKGEVERRVVAQLLATMDGLKSRGRVVVIAATNIPNSLDPALRRPGRFDREIRIGVPDKAGRLKILKIHTRNMPLAKAVNLDKIAEVTYGFVGADLEALAKEAAMIVLRRLLPELRKLKDGEDLSENVLNNLLITQEDFIQALKVVKPSAMREVLVEVPNLSWNDIGGLNDVKQELIEAVEWPLKYKSAFKRLGVKPPKGVLLYGPPGTGKTLLAKAVANESEANFISIKGPELLSKWVGESEKAIRQIFEKARQSSPTIIFFDEIDSLAPRRGMSDSSRITERIVNQLLTEIDGLKELNDVVIIGATNRPDILDTALLRPGRFDRIVLVGVPDASARKEIFKVHTSKMRLADDFDIDSLVESTQGYVGADIESLCREAAMLSLREDINAKSVSMKFFKLALKKVRPSVTKEIEESYKSLKDQFSQAKAEEFVKEKPNYYG